MIELGFFVDRILFVVGLWLIYFSVSYFAYLVAEKYAEPFNYWWKVPFKCRKCLTTWSLTAAYGSTAYIFNDWKFFITGLVLTALEALGLWITEKESGL